jgi:tRNA/rRNA methyltransferase
MIHIVLVSPQLPENVGAVARAMLNFGCKRLTVVNPRHSATHELAIANAAGADDVLHQANVVATLGEAIKDDEHVVGFSSHSRDMVKRYDMLNSDIAQTWTAKTALVFGCERSGLTNEDMAQCHSIVQIATNPEFTSLNLAQAVLLACSTWFASHNISSSYWHTGASPWAKTQEIRMFLSDLEQRLDEADYWKAQHKKNIMWRNLTNFFWRVPITEQEVRTLRGMVLSLFRR